MVDGFIIKDSMILQVLVLFMSWEVPLHFGELLYWEKDMEKQNREKLRTMEEEIDQEVSTFLIRKWKR